MPSPRSDAALRNLIARMHEPIDVGKVAEEEATRIMFRLDLRHPMTLSALLKVVSQEMQHGRLPEIEATARVLHARLLRRRQGADIIH